MARTFRKVHHVTPQPVEAEPAEAAPEPQEELSYRDLQGQAKDLGVKATLPREELEAAIAKAQK